VPADQRHAGLGGAFEGHLLFGGVEAAHHDAGGLQCQRLVQRRRAATHRALAVDHAHRPADGLAGFLDALADADDAAVFHVTGDEDDGLAGHRLRPGGGAVPLLLCHRGHRDALLRGIEELVGHGLAGKADGAQRQQQGGDPGAYVLHVVSICSW
jgi:hypothetical protein